MTSISVNNCCNFRTKLWKMTFQISNNVLKEAVLTQLVSSILLPLMQKIKRIFNMIIQLQELINQVFRAVQITKNLDNLFTIHVMFGQNTTIKPLLCTHHVTISQTLSPQELWCNLFLGKSCQDWCCIHLHKDAISVWVSSHIGLTTISFERSQAQIFIC